MAKAPASIKRATFGGGCFWGMEKWFRKEFGSALVSTSVGYMGGKTKNPNYRDVCTGQTGHAEVIDMKFDSQKTTYDDLLRYFWRIHDPTTANRQGNDIGTQYRSVVFFHDEEQANAARRIKEELDKKGVFKSPIVTEIVEAGEYYPGEEYHQLYLDKNPGGYCNHRPLY